MGETSKKKTIPLWRKLFFIGLTVLSGLFIAHGANVFDIQEVLANATILCLSCIGIG